MSERGELFHISLADFEREILPTLTCHDCVVRLQSTSPSCPGEPVAAASETAALDVVTEKCYVFFEGNPIFTLIVILLLCRVLSGPAKSCLLAVLGGAGEVEVDSRSQSVRDSLYVMIYEIWSLGIPLRCWYDFHTSA